MACCLTSLWLHCITGYIATKLIVNDRVYVLLSHRGQFECITFEPLFDPVNWVFYESPILARRQGDHDLMNLQMQIRGSLGRTVFRLQYHWVILATAMVSAYLILWKPRKQA
ncbi:MAG: hypothetical protein JWP89_5704 [Schlesneria sp.]|nr:hypothetical protein [Schlesneria sp.]